MSERIRDLPITVPGSAPSSAAGWQLEGAADLAGPWEPVNAGAPGADLRARFYADQNYYRLLVVTHAGGVTVGQPQVIPGRDAVGGGSRLRLV